MHQLGAFSILLLMLLGAAGCQLEKLDDPIIISDVETEFYLDLWENLHPTGRDLDVQMRTVASENCLNQTLVTELVKINRHFDLSIQDIQRPTDCEPGLAPVTASESIGALTPGDYSLTITLKDAIHNEGRLLVTKEAYYLSMETELGFKWLHREVRRVPDGSMWGYVVYSNSQNQGLVNDFLAEISSLTQTVEANTGYYGHFTVDRAAGELLVKGMPISDLHHTFLRRLSPADTEAIKAAVADFRATAPADVKLQVFTSRGDTW